MNKIKVLVFVDWFLPAYKAGGPITSMLALIQNLGNELDIVIVTGDRDIADTSSFKGILLDIGVLNSNLNVKIYYLSKTWRRFFTISQIIKQEQPEVIYVNGVFSFWFSFFPVLIKRLNLISAKVIVCPRGMLGDTTVNVKKFKKELFFSFIRVLKLYKNITWHATNSNEKDAIGLRFLLTDDVYTIPNIPIVGQTSSIVIDKEIGNLSLLFYSRILPIKNLELVLKAIADVNSAYRVALDIYGPIEDQNYWQKCSSLIMDLPPHIQVNYKGAVNAHVEQVDFTSYHFMVLPTLHENYGHAIAEALSCGCPVIISENTPWTNLESYTAGFCIDIVDSRLWTEKIEKCAQMNSQEYASFNEGARKYFDFKTDIKSLRKNYLAMFEGKKVLL